MHLVMFCVILCGFKMANEDFIMFSLKDDDKNDLFITLTVKL